MLLALGLVLGSTACSTSNHKSAGRVYSAHANYDGSAGALAGTSTNNNTPARAPALPAGYAALELNEGKKWVVAKPMMVHIRNLEKEVQDFERTTRGHDAVLAREIQENLGRLVTNCTMEGKAHDELHKWLMPFLGLSAEYSKATDPRVQQEKLREIKESLQVFHAYFE